MSPTFVGRSHLSIRVGHYGNVRIDAPLVIGLGYWLDAENPFGYIIAKFLLEIVVKLQARIRERSVEDQIDCLR